MGIVILMILYAILSIKTGQDVGEGIFIIVILTISALVGWFIIGPLSNEQDKQDKQDK